MSVKHGRIEERSVRVTFFGGRGLRISHVVYLHDLAVCEGPFVWAKSHNSVPQIAVAVNRALVVIGLCNDPSARTLFRGNASRIGNLLASLCRGFYTFTLYTSLHSMNTECFI